MSILSYIKTKKTFLCLINTSDTVKFSKHVFSKTAKERFIYTSHGRYEFRYNKKKRVNEFYNDRGQLLGTSSGKQYLFWTITSADTKNRYQDSYDKKGELKYLVNGREVVKAVSVKKKSGKSIELTVLNEDVENLDFVKALALAELVNGGQQSYNDELRSMVMLGVVTLSVILTVMQNQ